MVFDGGGWTLVRVDDSTNTNALKTAAAVNAYPTSSTVQGTCKGYGFKLSDNAIKALHTERLRYTILADLDSNGYQEVDSKIG